MTKYTIYIIKNKINEKVYIGATTKTIRHRFMRHKSYKDVNSTNEFYRDMALLGEENFFVEELEVTYDLYDARGLERYYIKKFDSINNGYNRATGGSIISNEALKEKYKNNKGENHPMFGKKQTEKNRQVVSNMFKGTKNNNSKGRIIIENKDKNIYAIKDSSRDAEKYLKSLGYNIIYKKVLQCCNNNLSYLGFTFKWEKNK